MANPSPSLPPGGIIPFFLSVLELALSLIDTSFALGILSGLFWYGGGGRASFPVEGLVSVVGLIYLGRGNLIGGTASVGMARGHVCGGVCLVAN